MTGGGNGEMGTSSGGTGGYTSGKLSMIQGQTLYIVVGGMGGSSYQSDNGTEDSIIGGYNGGAVGHTCPDGNNGSGGYGGGGGATHIAITDRGILSNYVSNINELLLVAGGGSGKGMKYVWDDENGFRGEWSHEGDPGTVAYRNGNHQNENYLRNDLVGGHPSGQGRGAGGGYHPGTADWSFGAYGGSGYIGGVTDGSMQNGIREGNGYAKITLVIINQS